MKTTEMKHTGARPVKMESAGDSRIYKIAMTGLFAALSYVVFTFLQFKITLPGGDATPSTWGTPYAFWGRCSWADFTEDWEGPSA